MASLILSNTGEVFKGLQGAGGKAKTLPVSGVVKPSRVRLHGQVVIGSSAGCIDGL